MNSALYTGLLHHRRFAPKPHAFRYGLYMMYLDLAELDKVFAGRWLWSTRRWAVARFQRSDHLGAADVPLEQAVRDLVEQRTGRRPEGPIRLLTHLRLFGYVFNPVSFYYCFDAAGNAVETIVAEVNNTPWGEQHCYVLDQAGAPKDRAAKDGAPRHHRFAKDFHVSPFMPMAIDYDWAFGDPGQRLRVHMTLNGRAQAGRGEGVQKMFDATLSLKREPVTGATLAGVLVRFPLMTLKVIAGIHWEALRLWLKGVPVFTHAAKAARPVKPINTLETLP